MGVEGINSGTHMGHFHLFDNSGCNKMNMNTTKMGRMNTYFWILAFLLAFATEKGFSAEFDFIVVGGGTAGCAVASRLSENPGYTVLLIHDGGIADPKLEVPALTVPIMFDPANVKFYDTTQSKELNSLTNRIAPYVVGKPIGGTSAIGGMFYNRGSPKDYDNWANITGDNSWNYESMLKHLKKVENYDGGFPSDQHAKGGPIWASRSTYTPQLDQWLAAGKELNYTVNVDPNGPQKVSFAPVEFWRKFGRRVNSYDGYIKPYLEKRKNLHVLLNAEANRIIFQGKKAIGVSYTEKLNEAAIRKEYATARKEIIVSCGVIGSPVLLMRSGIGPKSVLEASRIDPVDYLPVGEILSDHVFLGLAFVVNNKSVIFDTDRDLTPEAYRIYNETGDGPYSSLGGANVQVFSASSQAILEGHGDWADLHLFNGLKPFVDLTAFSGNIDTRENEGLVFPSVFLGRPKSEGWVRLNKTNADFPPEINLQYFTDTRDMKMFIEGIKLVFKIYEETSTFKKLGARYPTVYLEACKNLPFRSDEYWRCYVMNHYHAGMEGGGTCRMGAGPQDKKAVVDSHLRVIGIKGLRVVDGSVMPERTNANPTAPIYAIAEKASEMILKDWAT